MTLLSTQITYALGWTLLHSLWQGALVTLVLAMLLALMGKASANIRYWVAVAALGGVLCLSLITFGYYYSLVGSALQDAVQNTDMSVYESGDVSVVWTAQAWVNRQIPHLVLLWALGFSFCFFRYCGAFYYCQRLKNYLSVPAAREWQRIVARLSGVLNISREVTLKVTSRVSVPCVVGHIKPVILMPAALLTQLSSEEVEAILLHELGHIRRHDYLVGLVQSLIKTLYFFNWPVLWINSKIDYEREMACDDIAANSCKSRLFYAETLTRFSMLSNDGGLTMAVTGNKQHLLARIQHLFEPSATVVRPFEGLLVSFLLLVFGLSLSIQTQADSSYPNIESLDDVSVQQIIDGYKQQIFLNPDEGGLVTNIAPTPELQSLTQQERNAFIQYFRQSIWDNSIAKWERSEMWKSLSENEWNDLKNIFFEQHYGHYVNALSTGALSPTVYTVSVKDVPDDVQVALLENNRWEATIPVQVIDLIHSGNLKRLSVGPMQIFSQQDGRLIFLIALSEDMPDFPNRRAVMTDDMEALYRPGEKSFFHTVGVPSSEEHSVVFANASFLQVSTGKPNVEKILTYDAVRIGDATGGLKVTTDGVLEFAFDPERRSVLSAKVSQYIDSKYMFSPEKPKNSLADKLEDLPDDLHQYLYTPEQLQRWLMVSGMKRGVPLTDREKPFYKKIYQEMRADMLLELYKNNKDVGQEVKKGMTAWIDDDAWVVIVPERVDELELTFDFLIEEKPLGEAIVMAGEQCELPDISHLDFNPERLVSLFGYSTHCGQLQHALQTMITGGPTITAN